MSAAVGLRDDFTAADLRRLAGKAKDADQARRLLALAAVYDGMDRATAARIGGMDRQTLRDWAHRFNEHGPIGLINVKPIVVGRSCRWSNKRHCGSWWRPAPIRRSMAWCAGDAWTCSVSLEPSSASICRQSRLVASSSGLASRISAPARCTPHRMRRRLRLLKKLPRSGRRGCEYTCAGNADRDLVPG
jgi:Winged helix-turn helix